MEGERGSSSTSDEALRVIFLSQRKAKHMVQTQADEIRARIQQGRTFTEIAEELIPASFEISSGVAQRIVALAVRDILDPDTVAHVQTENKREGSRRAGRKGRRPGARDNALRAQGKEPWKPGEREYFRSLLSDPSFQYPQGTTHAGKPDATLIALALNRRFHASRPVRSTIACQGQIRLERRSCGEEPKQYMDWSPLKDRLIALARDSALRRPTGESKAGAPNFIVIAQMLNDEFFGGHPVVDAKRCSTQFSYYMADRAKE